MVQTSVAVERERRVYYAIPAIAHLRWKMIGGQKGCGGSRRDVLFLMTHAGGMISSTLSQLDTSHPPLSRSLPNPHTFNQPNTGDAPPPPPKRNRLSNLFKLSPEICCRRHTGHALCFSCCQLRIPDIALRQDSRDRARS
ncbi:hypothetical protein BD324DRAFT_630400 [Kockovaella imperatae]|uniref:Uncharacterized protein n=1 Tax=Kockovaella imperatae TaxID=4999 RepID=A0A1Y1UDP4_9TREE|nr:hypothetical protein BD324DRAFT_630400 [Kockovaella imperatae]ORX36153.1 hypothetical protein BD324DRAFT_630400 [Kockovaella imperatae]